LQRWADAGKLNRKIPYPLSLLERSAAQQFVAVEQALMFHNMYLAMQAMGLGGWMFDTGSPLIVLGGTSMPGLGFRFVHPPAGSKNGLPNPVGLDGLFKAYWPPYYPGMVAAVDAVVAAKWGQGGLFTSAGGPVPFRQQQVLQDAIPVSPDEVIQMTKDSATTSTRPMAAFQPSSMPCICVCGSAIPGGRPNPVTTATAQLAFRKHPYDNTPLTGTF
jgi:hypothetical protein